MVSRVEDDDEHGAQGDADCPAPDDIEEVVGAEVHPGGRIEGGDSDRQPLPAAGEHRPEQGRDGLNTIAGFAGHMTLVGIFLIWAGRDAFGSFDLPDPKAFLVGIGASSACC